MLDPTVLMRGQRCVSAVLVGNSVRRWKERRAGKMLGAEKMLEIARISRTYNHLGLVK